MKRLVLLPLPLALIATPAVADKPPPAGSYQGSCATIHYNVASLLQAQCKSYAGKYAWTQLTTNNCKPGSIFNDDGTLRCIALSIGTATGQLVWPGSYLKSCRWTQVVDNGRNLFAGCNSGGKVHPTTLDLRKCSWGKDIANTHGTLTC